MGSDSEGEEKGGGKKVGVDDKWTQQRSRVWRDRKTTAAAVHFSFFFSFSPIRPGLLFLSCTHTHTPDPSCHLMPVEHEINRHSWYKQAREQIHSHVQAEPQSCRMERSAEEIYRSADEAVASQTNAPWPREAQLEKTGIATHANVRPRRVAQRG